MVEINRVEVGSIADELNINTGDKLLEINGNKVNDYIDYQYSIAADFFVLTIEKKNGQLWDFEIEKDPDEKLGLILDGIVYDNLKSCQNNCLFCFVKQQPSGMRDSLILKDDDYRFSFLQGSFITLTNLKEEEFQRILNMKLSPLYVSVHTTNPELRVEMMKNTEAAKIFQRLSTLADNGISFHTQIVLCPGYNDGNELDRSISDLINFYPKLVSIGIVPVGLTKFRYKLPDLKGFDPQNAKKTIKQLKKWQEKLKIKFGTNFLYGSDELYFLAEDSLPELKDYNGFPQLENGIGLTRLMWNDFSSLKLPKRVSNKTVGLITGFLGNKALKPIVNELKKISGLDILTIPVLNNFFGNSVTVTGLLTGKDIIMSLNNMDNKPDHIIIPRIVLNKDNYFLDDLTINDFKKQFPEIIFSFVNGINEMVEVLIND